MPILFQQTPQLQRPGWQCHQNSKTIPAEKANGTPESKTAPRARCTDATRQRCPYDVPRGARVLFIAQPMWGLARQVGTVTTAALIDIYAFTLERFHIRTLAHGSLVSGVKPT
jgi:hypothetical protein